MMPKSLPSTTTFTPVPDPLLGELLKDIDSLDELKCILRALWHIHRRKGPLRCVTLQELKADPVLRNDMSAEEIEDAMTGGAQRGIFARAMVGGEGGRTTIFVLNQEVHRAALRRVMAGDIEIPAGLPQETAANPKMSKRPNIYDIYEQEMGGLLTPAVAEELKAVEKVYPQSWIADAMREASRNNKRSWRYVLAILRSWETEGKSDGNFGRNTKARDPRRYIEEYERRRGIPSGS